MSFNDDYIRAFYCDEPDTAEAPELLNDKTIWVASPDDPAARALPSRVS